MKKIVLGLLSATLILWANNDSYDPQQDFMQSQKACESGDMDKCFNVGLLYEYGEGVESSYSKAALFFKQACDGGMMMGCTVVGLMYELGKGVSQEDSKAFTFYKKACDGGDKNGCDNFKRLSH